MTKKKQVSQMEDVAKISEALQGNSANQILGPIMERSKGKR